MSSMRLRSQGLEPPVSGGRNRGSSSIPAEIGGGAVRTSARPRTRRQESSPRSSQEPRPRSRHFSPLSTASLIPLNTGEVRVHRRRGRPAAARQESSARSSRHVISSVELRGGLGRPGEARRESFPQSSQDQVPRHSHSHQWHIPVEVSREAATEARGRSRGRGVGGGRPVPTFHDDQRQMPAPVLQYEELTPAISSPEAPELQANLTIDLTDSPTTTTTSTTISTSMCSNCQDTMAGNPPSPALQCPVCLESFSAIRSRGCGLVSTICGHVFCQGCFRQSILTRQHCPTCRRRIGPQDFHPLFL